MAAAAILDFIWVINLCRRVFDILPFATAKSRAKIKLLPVLENG